MKKIRSFCFALFATILSLFVLVSCDSCDEGRAKSTVVEKSDTLVVIKTTDVQGRYSLEDCLDDLEDAGTLSVEEENGMIVSLNGVANQGSSYWFIYTSDEQSVNKTWGSCEYAGKTYYSAALGVEELKEKEGALYIFVYETYQG